MLELQITATELFDEATGEFVTIEPQTLRLEHSLYAVAKWESKWKKPFLPSSKKDTKTFEETLDYIRCMSLDEIDPTILKALKAEDFKKIDEYMNDPMTATWFSKKEDHRPGREVVTAEIMYYWMVAAQIPFECQYWHLNRFMTLVRVVNIKNQPPKKMSKNDIYKQNSAINKARRKPRKP